MIVDTKIKSEKNSYFHKGWLFVGTFKVGSVPGMINKDVLAQFIYKSTSSTEKIIALRM